jgi:hypothetical protein
MNLANLKRQLDEAKSLSAPRIAILWGQEDLLGGAIESFLTMAKNWRVVKILGCHDDNLLTQEVKKIKPDIVVINQGDYAGNFSPPIHLFQDLPNMKIIIVNFENNLVEVYNKQKIRIMKATDLLSIIDEHQLPLQEEVNYKT